MTMGVSRRMLALALVCSAWLLPRVASAGESIVQQQLYDLGGRFEVMITPSFSVFDKYTRHMSASAGAAYFFNDFIGVEVEGGYAYIHGDRNLLNEIVSTAVDTLEGIQRLPLSDLKYMTWHFQGGAVFNPLYGKLSLSSELAVSFHLYFVAGAGAANYRYHELGDALPDGSGFFKNEADAGVKVNFYFGGGLRFHLRPSNHSATFSHAIGFRNA